MRRAWSLLLVASLVCLLTAAGASAQDKKKAKPKPKKPIATVPAEVEKAFVAMDKDHDWRISLDEYKADKPDAAKAEQEFKTIDKNGDTFITLWELKAFMDKKSQPPKQDKKDDKKDDKKADKKADKKTPKE